MWRQRQNLGELGHCPPNGGPWGSTSSLRRLEAMINERYRGGVLVNDYLPLGVDAPPGFRIRWGFFFVVDELKTRFFFDETSSGVGGVNIEESNRPLRRREFVGNGGTGVVDLDSA